MEEGKKGCNGDVVELQRSLPLGEYYGFFIVLVRWVFE